jgi:hypothetical protein
MNWDAVVSVLGAIGIGAAALAWLTKKLVSQLLDRDLEKFKGNLQLEAQKQVIEFGALHARRAELIAQLYEKIHAVNQAAGMLPMHLMRREFQRQYAQEQRFSLEPHEKRTVDALTVHWRELSDFYSKNKSICAIRMHANGSVRSVNSVHFIEL